MALNFNVEPYYDDFEAASGAKSQNYMRILFRPGYAVQARELTQLQSILQNQLKAFGNHIFQDGSPVFGGHISLDTTVISLRLEQQYANVDIELSDFLPGGNSTLITQVGNTTPVRAQVVALDDSQDDPIIIVKYLTGNKFANGASLQIATGVQSSATLVAANATSQASVVSINEGIFYSGGYFVQVDPQTIVLDSSSVQPTYRIGLEIEETIIDEIDDSNLLDPAQSSFNYQAPGATRYQYNLVLAKRTLDSVDDSAFYELLRVENGLITKQVKYPIYADLEKTLARRTYDQSGDFTVQPFVITTKDNPANTLQYGLTVEPGKAYVKGFEFETIGVQKLYASKARSTNTITDHSASLEYGNIVVVKNLNGGNSSGIFDISNYANVDLHTVASANINTAGVAGYTSTKIGSAKLRNIEFLGLGNYYAYLTDISLTPNTATASAGNLISATLPAHYSANSNSYVNVAVTVTTSGISDDRRISSYNGSTKELFFDRALTTAAGGTSTINLNFSTKDTDSIVVAPTAYATNVYATQNSTAAIYACMDISVAGQDITGNTVISDTQFNKMIFALPNDFIAQNTIVNASFFHRKNLWSQTFTSGNLTITSGSGLGTGESFSIGAVGGYITDASANNNFLVIVKNKQSSNRANGEIITFNRGSVAAGNGVYQTTTTSVTLATSSNNTFVGDVIATVRVTNAADSSVARRTKTLVGNVSNTTLVATDNYTNGTAIIGTPNASTVFLDTSNGHLWFINANDIVKSPALKQSLYVPDVFAITKIYDSGNPNFKPNVSNAIDITSRYYLDSGQRDNYYDHAGIILKQGARPPAGQTVVFLQYFSHDSILGFFSADSYSANVYSRGIIPYYSSQAFGTFALRDSIDFRPTRSIGTSANVQSFSLIGLKLPQPDNAMILTYQFYLPRIDKLLLSKDKLFKIKEGTPAQYPQPPADSDDSMTLYILNVPAFTANVDHIQAQYIENKRYTMKDIGNLEARLNQIEYYTVLNHLETQALADKVLYRDGVTAKDSYGIIADNFGSFTIADNKTSDLSCYLQPGAFSPLRIQTPLKLKYVSSSGGTVDTKGKTLSLGWTEVDAIVQDTATKYISVQPYLFGQFRGTLKLTPQSDYWFSQILIPSVTAAPGTTAVEIPPAPVPPAATTLANTVVEDTRTSPTVVSSLVDIGPVFDSSGLFGWYGGWSIGGIGLTAVDVQPTVFSYGIMSTPWNWFGVDGSFVTDSSMLASTSTPNLGTSIQLDPVQNNLDGFSWTGDFNFNTSWL